MDRFVGGLKPVIQQDIELRDLQIFTEVVRIVERVNTIDFQKLQNTSYSIESYAISQYRSVLINITGD